MVGQTMKTYTIIQGRLYQRGRTNSLSLSVKQEAATRLGLKLIVAVCPQPDRDWYEVRGVERAYALEMTDGKTVPPDIHDLVRDVAARFRQDDPILVYCNAGRNRSSLFSALLLMDVYGWDAERAIGHVRQQRPRALANPVHEEYLLKWGMRRR